MLIDANKIENNTILKGDICIIGAGIAGIVLAKELLSLTNKNIILVESSEYYDPEVQNLYKAQSRPKFFPAPLTSRLRFFGGTSWHWENSTERLDPIDFKKRDWIPNSGWPIKYSKLLKYYPKAEEYCGVGTEGYETAYWKKRIGFNDIFSSSENLETAISKSAIPTIKFSLKYGKELLQNKRLQFLCNANFTDIEYSNETEIVKNITVKTFSGKKHEVKAQTFIMALGGIENARMLLHINEKYNNKIGNQYDNVGRYFMEHPTIRAAHLLPTNGRIDQAYAGVKLENFKVGLKCNLTEQAQFKNKTNNMRILFSVKDKLSLSDGIASAHVLKNSYKSNDIPDDFGTHLVNMIKDIDHISEAFLRKEYQNKFFENADKFGGYQLIAMTEQSPERNNRVTLGSTKDRLGIKKVEIKWKVSDKDKKLAWNTLNVLAKDSSLQKIGRLKLLKERKSRIWGSQLGFGFHHMGTTRMSNDIKTGVVDAQLKVYGTKNLYVNGCSVFPTGGHVPPTLTIVAMSIMFAHDIANRGV